MLFSCALPSDIGAPAFPLPSAALSDDLHASTLNAADWRRAAGCMVLALAARPAVAGHAEPPPQARNAGCHRVDAGAESGRVVPVLLREAGGAARLPPLPLQVRVPVLAKPGCKVPSEHASISVRHRVMVQ